jgi:hypothetical protein
MIAALEEEGTGSMSHALSIYRPTVEPLEDRCVPANFGLPWLDPRHLTLSFAPDGMSIDGQPSSLFQFLNSRTGGDTAAWQREILRAFQTWAVHGNINLAVTADGGQAFGIEGAPQGDTRFGDIRLGARNFSTEVLSLMVSPDPSTGGTWGGDVMLNTASAYIQDLSVLYRVMLHEAANVLGLRDSVNPNSVRYPFFNPENTVPLAEDIAAIQAIYGARAADDYEGSYGNDSWSKAAKISYAFLAAGGDGSAPLTAYADLTTANDVDYYWFKPPQYYNGPVTIRLQTEGVSLLIPKITVYNKNGAVIGSATADDPTGSILTVNVSQAHWADSIYLKVEGATEDVFSMGSYALGISFDERLDVAESTIQQVLAAPLGDVNSWFVDYSLLEPATALLNVDLGLNDIPLLAWSLDTLQGFAYRTAYETIGSLHSNSDKDFYKVMSPTDTANSVLTVDLWSLSSSLTQPAVRVYNASGQLVTANTIVQCNGTTVLQVANAQANAKYYVEVWHGPQGGNGQKGNYGLSVRFGSVLAASRTFKSDTLTNANTQDTGHFYVAQTQFFSLNLAAQQTAGPAGARVQFKIIDSLGQTRLTLEAGNGESSCVNTLLLGPGTYSVVATLLPGYGAGTQLNYQLTGQSLSDPIGPQLGDASNQPLFLDGTNPPLFRYPGDIVTIDPFLLIFTG